MEINKSRGSRKADHGVLKIATGKPGLKSAAQGRGRAMRRVSLCETSEAIFPGIGIIRDIP